MTASQDPRFVYGVGVPVTPHVAETAAIVAGTAYAYTSQERKLAEYDLAHGIDPSLPREVRAHLRKQQETRAPLTGAQMLIICWILGGLLALLFIVFVTL